MASPSESAPLLSINNLTTAFEKDGTLNAVIRDVNLWVERGEVVAIVGESGSGKSVTSLSLMGLLPPQGKIVKGEIHLEGSPISNLSEKEMRHLRGVELAMIFQEPMTSLNPVMRVGAQVMELLNNHNDAGSKENKSEVISLFERVRIPEPESSYSKYPHEMSGGQRQRVMIAMALAAKPKVLVADEPTTALDVTVQKAILDLLIELKEELDTGIIFITHDLGVVADFADRVVVMKNGEIVEHGAVQQVMNEPSHPYTEGLLACRPVLNKRLSILPTVDQFLSGTVSPRIEDHAQREKRHRELYSSKPLIRVQGLSVEFSSPAGPVTAVDDVSFDIHPGETFGLVGESGCGKTTLSRALLKLQPIKSGEVLFEGRRVVGSESEKLDRGKMQIIFQDPYSSLNPTFTIERTLNEPLRVHKAYASKKERREAVHEILERVEMPIESLRKYPHEFSGGQRQRIAIARALLLKPSLVICDESVSALDVSVQAKVLNLLNELKRDLGLTYLFISHDLSVVKHMSDRIMVMRHGRVVEIQEADELYRTPKSDYTRQLIEAIPGQ